MRIAIGSVVKGFELKTAIKQHLHGLGHQVLDAGCHDATQFVKFPSIGERIAWLLRRGEAELAISCCGSGAGAAIAAGKFRGVCAVSCESVETARLIRVINGANCLCLGGSIVSSELALNMADAFLAAEFQKVEGIPKPIVDFWKEARDELMNRGDEAKVRAMETLP